MIKGALAAVLAFTFLCAVAIVGLYLFAGWRVQAMQPLGSDTQRVAAIVAGNGRIVARLPYSAWLNRLTGAPELRP